MHFVRARLRLLLLLVLTPLAALAADATPKTFDLPADDAARSLKRFATQSGLEVLFASDATAGIRTTAVQGTLLPLEAAQRLVAGTRLAVAQNPQTSALIVTATATSSAPTSFSPA